MSSTYYIEITVPIEAYEETLGILYAQGMSACQELSRPDAMELTCYFETRSAAQSVADHGVAAYEPSTVQEQREYDWNSKWRESIEPVWITDDIVVSPVWREPSIRPGQHWIQIEPKMAFGTGHHETTQLAAAAVLAEQGNRLLDVGTGSGILLFVAAIAGYTHAHGVEIDPACEDNLRENLGQNKSACHISYDIGTLSTISAHPPYDTVVVNIIKQHSCPIVEKLPSYLRPGGVLLWSGILCEERDEVVSFAQKVGFVLCHEGTKGEWWYGRFRLRG
ncbi:50S ribosomal protein L11 methyltransferase [Chitinivibrio alkaliphilus]|nr:50S ribosomal protein L11 methyltransferase [Chitinivibrio alkaliphilus]